MADYVGRWDCPGCKTRVWGIQRFCPNCGHETTGKWYLPKGEPPTTAAEVLEIIKQGPNWQCHFCDSDNYGDQPYCTQCGAAKADGERRQVVHYDSQDQVPSAADEAVGAETDLIPGDGHDQFMDENYPDDRPGDQDVPEIFPPDDGGDDYEPKRENDWGERSNRSFPLSGQQVAWILGILLVIGLIAGGLYMFLHTKEVQATVDHVEWSRSIEIDGFKTVREEDWSIPAGGRYVSQRQKQDGTDTYQCGTEPKTESYQCGSHSESCGMTNNGNGTFSSCTRTVPDYCSRSVQVAKYCTRPVYRTAYTYDIDRWVHSRSVPTSGSNRDDPAPYWGEFTLQCADQTIIGCERENHRDQTYLVFFKDEEGEIREYKEDSQSDWNQYQFGASYTLRVNHLGQIRNDPLRPED